MEVIFPVNKRKLALKHGYIKGPCISFRRLIFSAKFQRNIRREEVHFQYYWSVLFIILMSEFSKYETSHVETSQKEKRTPPKKILKKYCNEKK